MTKPESLDCVAVKRRAQRALAKALAGKSPDEQAKMLRDLAAQAPLWKELSKARASGRGRPCAHRASGARPGESRRAQTRALPSAAVFPKRCAGPTAFRVADPKPGPS